MKKTTLYFHGASVSEKNESEKNYFVLEHETRLLGCHQSTEFNLKRQLLRKQKMEMNGLE